MLSLALDAMPQCTGQLITRGISHSDRVTRIIQTLMMNGAVLVPYPCCRADKYSLELCDLSSGIIVSLFLAGWLCSTVGRMLVFGRRTDPVLRSACS